MREGARQTYCQFKRPKTVMARSFLGTTISQEGKQKSKKPPKGVLTELCHVSSEIHSYKAKVGCLAVQESPPLQLQRKSLG